MAVIRRFALVAILFVMGVVNHQQVEAYMVETEEASNATLDQSFDIMNAGPSGSASVSVNKAASATAVGGSSTAQSATTAFGGGSVVVNPYGYPPYYPIAGAEGSGVASAAGAASGTAGAVSSGSTSGGGIVAANLNQATASNIVAENIGASASNKPYYFFQPPAMASVSGGFQNAVLTYEASPYSTVQSSAFGGGSGSAAAAGLTSAAAKQSGQSSLTSGSYHPYAHKGRLQQLQAMIEKELKATGASY